MGDFRVRKINNAEDKHRMYQYALRDIEALDFMLHQNMFDSSHPKIGAEQELCLVDNKYDPSKKALDVLDSIDEERYTNELALFNMEINLDPYSLEGDCFSKTENSLLELLKLGREKAAAQDTKILMTGILPSLRYRHLQFDYMTPIRRYQTLSNSLANIRGSKFEIYMQGADDLIMSLESVLFEACNTSFQLHLQIHPEEFINKHNWSQMIAGPVLSACVNSPLVFGNELWAESRIAIFKQSLDTRSSTRYLRKKLPRVYFGGNWLKESASELWKNDIMRFPLLVTSDDFMDAQEVLRNGDTPDLRAIRLHNGTTYTWNRLCYGHPKGVPHLRIECRYLPAGPSALDEMANFAFWIGLMNIEPPNGQEFWKDIDFKTAKNNFIKAARYGLDVSFQWFGKDISARQLLLEELIPMAEKGLQKMKIDSKDIDRYLGYFKERVARHETGSSWQVRNFRKLKDKCRKGIAQRILVQHSIEHQEQNIPLLDWAEIKSKQFPVPANKTLVEDLMTTDIFTIDPEDSIELIQHIFEWKKIHHLPVEDLNGDLVGMITDGMLKRLNKEDQNSIKYAQDIMIKEPITVKIEKSYAYLMPHP